MFDLKKIKKENCYMIEAGHEDMATWWNILKNGYVAYGLNEALSYYRIHKNSKSHKKINSIKNRWILYRKYENLSIIKSSYYFVYYKKNYKY